MALSPLGEAPVLKVERPGKVAAWRKALAARPSVQAAVPADYTKLYLDRLKGQDVAVLKIAA